MLQIDFADEAARVAYMAGLNAARALIFERTDTIAKTHGGTHSRFAELTRDDLLDERSRKFLGSAFQLKTSNDYGVGPIDVVTTSLAENAVEAATDLIKAIEGMLTDTGERDT